MPIFLQTCGVSFGQKNWYRKMAQFRTTAKTGRNWPCLPSRFSVAGPTV